MFLSYINLKVVAHPNHPTCTHFVTRYLFPVLVARGFPRGVGFDSDMKVNSHDALLSIARGSH